MTIEPTHICWYETVLKTYKNGNQKRQCSCGAISIQTGKHTITFLKASNCCGADLKEVSRPIRGAVRVTEQCTKCKTKILVNIL